MCTYERSDLAVDLHEDLGSGDIVDGSGSGGRRAYRIGDRRQAAAAGGRHLCGQASDPKPLQCWQLTEGLR